MNVCVCRFGVIFTYVIEGIDLKVISVCLIIDNRLLQTYIYLFMKVQNAHQFHSNVQRRNFLYQIILPTIRKDL